MDAPSRADLDAVFVGPMEHDGPGPVEPAPPPEETAEMDQALDDAIDELFAAEDPAARREAFKRAISLCKESEY